VTSLSSEKVLNLCGRIMQIKRVAFSTAEGFGLPLLGKSPSGHAGSRPVVGEESCGAVVSVHFQEDIFSIRNKTAISHTTIA
jgi:hypothetical protein